MGYIINPALDKVMSLEWCLLRNDLTPKPHIICLVLGQLTGFSWDTSPNVPEVTAQSHLGHLPTSPHTDWHLPHVTVPKGTRVCAGPHVGVPIRDFSPRPCSLFALQKWDPALA